MRDWSPGDCDSCGAIGLPVTPIDRRPGSHRTDATASFCRLCYSSFAGNAYWYHEQYGENGEILRHVCLIANLSIKQIVEQLREERTDG